MKPNWFVAFSVSPDVWYKDIYKNIEEPMRKFHPEDLHSTLVFLGYLENGEVESVKRVMDDFDEKSVSITLGKLLFLPALKKYSAVSYSIEQGNKTLQEYMKKYRDRFSVAAQRDLDSRSPLPHITIARPPKKMTGHEKQTAAMQLQKLPIPQGEIKIDTLDLYTWADHRQSRQFKIIWSKKLR